MHLHKQSQENYMNLISPMKLTNSASDQNICFTYVCLVNEVKPSLTGNDNDMTAMDRGQRSCDVDNSYELVQEQPIQVGRSKALHELVEKRKITKISEHTIERKCNTTNFEDASDLSDSEDYNQYVNPKKLTLTKMKWLSEGREGSIDSSSPCLSLSSSATSTCSQDTNEMDCRPSFGDKCLSTILKLDREHNMFGLSNIAIVGRKTSKKIRKDEKPLFPQTAIIQICCAKGCCKHRSNTDLPASLKCGSCRSCCLDPYCLTCVGPCGPSCVDLPYPLLCNQCPRGTCSSKTPCQPSKCNINCNNCYGMKIYFKRKPTYEASSMELTPRSSCILHKPLAARSCHHLPHCIPPSSCFPYLMPCYWPARAGAPCNDPSRCFHNPPCRPPRKRKFTIPAEEMCPTTGKCADDSQDAKCPNENCPGANKIVSVSSEKVLIKTNKRKEKRKITICECDSPNCSSCFVKRYKVTIVKSDKSVNSN